MFGERKHIPFAEIPVNTLFYITIYQLFPFIKKLLLFYIFSANTFRGSLVAATVQTAVFFTRSRVSQRIVKKRRSVLTIGGGEDQKN